MKKPEALNYVFISEKSKDISDKILISKFRDCSFRNHGWMYKLFLSSKTCPKSKVVYCLYKKELVAWGLRAKDPSIYSIMLYVKKNHRRLGIGSKIFKKLCAGLSRKQIEYWPHNTGNSKFFKSVDKKQNDEF